MTRLLIAALLLTSASAFANDCSKPAIQNAEAVAALMYQNQGLEHAKTMILSTDNASLTYLITTSDASSEPLHCTYKVQMEGNSQGDCWMVAIEQTECSQ